MSRLSIIVPTIGRPTLKATLDSIAEQWDGEQVIVLTHKDAERAGSEIFHACAPDTRIDGVPAWTYVGIPDHGKNFYGHDLRNFALDADLVRGTHIATIDDDDIYVDGALSAMAEAVAGDASVTVFKARWGTGHPASGVVLWDHPHVAMGNVATPMIVAQRSPARYGLDYFGDLKYALDLTHWWARDEWYWDERVICEVRPAPVEDVA